MWLMPRPSGALTSRGLAGSWAAASTRIRRSVRLSATTQREVRAIMGFANKVLELVVRNWRKLALLSRLRRMSEILHLRPVTPPPLVHSKVVEYDEWALWDQEKCAASFFMVANLAYDQGYWIHPFCPPEGRTEGCLRCRYTSADLHGKSDRQFIKWKKYGKMPADGEVTYAKAIQAGYARPVVGPVPALMNKGSV